MSKKQYKHSAIMCIYIYILIYIYIYIYILYILYIYILYSWACLSPLQGWGSLTMAFTGKFAIYSRVWITTSLCLCNSKFYAYAISGHSRSHIIFLLPESKKRKRKVSITNAQYWSILSLFLWPQFPILVSIFLFSCLHLLINSDRLFNMISSGG